METQPNAKPPCEGTKNASSWTNLKAISDKVNKGIAYAFRRWPHFVSKNPYRVIICATLFAVVWTVAFFFQLTLELDNQDLFTPKDAKSFEDKDYVDSLYESYPQRSRIITVRRGRGDSDSGNCADRLLLSNEESARRNNQAYFRFYEELEKVQIKYDNKFYNLNEICVKPSDSENCLVTSVLDLWDYNASIINAEDFNPLRTINSGNLTTRFGLPFDSAFCLGEPDSTACEGGTGFLSSDVEAFAMTIPYVYELEEVDGA